MTDLPSQETILKRINDRKPEDFFGFEVSDYIDALTFENAKPFLKDGVTEAQWEENRLKSREEVLKKMRDYVGFAFDKARDKKGLSAGRSISHYRAWIWLVGDTELSDWLDDYSDYGIPQLERICQHYSFEIPVP